MHASSTEWLAYTSSRGGTFDIWLRPANALHYRLTRGLGESFSIPYWSPDSRRIAFIGRGNVVFVVDVRTGAVARIDQIEPYTLIDWSPDGESVVYVKSGRIVLYNVLTHRHSDIAQPGAADAQWFPSGRELLFASPDAAGNTQLYRIGTDGANKRQLTRNTAGPLHNVRLSPSGAAALFTTPGASVSLIGVVDLATGDTHMLQGGPLGKNYYPAWSPGSSAIAYSATEERSGGYGSLIQTDRPEGGRRQTQATSDCFATPVSWSPDGARLAYLTGCGQQDMASRIALVDIRTGARYPVAEGGRIAALQFSRPISITRYATYSNPVYHVAFPYPAHWHEVTSERYEGSDGFFEITAAATEGTIEDLCQSEANHPLKPYGSKPRIVHTRVRGRRACLIFPSDDQPAEMRHQAALLVEYPKPVVIRGQTYPYFVLWADETHLERIGQGLAFT